MLAVGQFTCTAVLLSSWHMCALVANVFEPALPHMQKGYLCVVSQLHGGAPQLHWLLYH